MKQIRLANRYAKALFELALEQQKLEIVAEDMQLINDVIAENRDLALLLKSPVVNSHKKTSVLSALFEKNIDHLSLRFLSLLAKNGREDIIPQIAESLLNIYNDYRGITDAWLTSASELEKDAKTAILTMLKRLSGKEVRLHEYVNADLLGGFVVKLGDYQYDASTKTLIKRLKDNIKNNLIIAGK
ncbi:MAG: ATP synthase F1 subunit delta [Bacteroidales bacterium]|jgi:F-type H+-transporting ATPase subunit delta|nr:ATP synthase F1 subunit delta [Bacteroidales bacterium]